MLFLWRGWDLHVAWFVQRFMEVSRWGSETKFQLLSLSHSHLSAQSPSLTQSLTNPLTHLMSPLQSQPLPRLHPGSIKCSLSHSGHHIVWFATSFTSWFVHLLPHLLPYCLYSLIILCSGIKSSYRLVVALQYFSSRSNYVTFSPNA